MDGEGARGEGVRGEAVRGFGRQLGVFLYIYIFIFTFFFHQTFFAAAQQRLTYVLCALFCEPTHP